MKAINFTRVVVLANALKKTIRKYVALLTQLEVETTVNILIEDGTLVEFAQRIWYHCTVSYSTSKHYCVPALRAL